MTAETDYAAIKTAVDAQFATVRAYDPDDAKAIKTDHVLLFLSRRFTGHYRGSGEESSRGGRVLTRYVGKTVSNVRDIQRRVRLAIEDQILSGDVGPFVFETEDSINDDGDGWFTAADSWTY